MVSEQPRAQVTIIWSTPRIRLLQGCLFPEPRAIIITLYLKLKQSDMDIRVLIITCRGVPDNI